MVFTVAVIAVAPGAVTEFQIRMGYICSAADSTPVGIGRFGFCGGRFIGTGIERNDLWLLFCRSRLFAFADHPTEIGSPGNGNHIQYIFAEEQEIVGKGNDTEQIIGERQGYQIQYNDDQIKQGEDPCLDRDKEKQKKMSIRIQRGITEEQTEVQISDICLATQDHAVDIHQNHAGEIEQIEFQCSPDILHGTTKRIVTQQGNGNQNQIAVAGSVGEGVGKQPPDLSLQNAFPVEAEDTVQSIVSGHLTYQINDGGTYSDIQHQIWNAFISVCVAEPFKICAKIFQIQSLLVFIGLSLFYQQQAEKSITDL